MSCGWSHPGRVENWVFFDSSWLLPGSLCIFKDRNSVHPRFIFVISQTQLHSLPVLHHLFYNETHHGYGLWVPSEFTELSHSWGLDREKKEKKRKRFLFLTEAAGALALQLPYMYWKTKQSISYAVWHFLHPLSFIISHLSLSPHIDGYKQTILTAFFFFRPIPCNLPSLFSPFQCV